MARPIEATPPITGQEAKELLKELEAPLVISAKKERELEKCHALYLKFSKQRLTSTVK